MLSGFRGFGESEIAHQRMQIIRFYESYGEPATREAYGVDRKLTRRWWKRLEEDGKLSTLIPYSTRPRRIRISAVRRKFREGKDEVLSVD